MTKDKPEVNNISNKMELQKRLSKNLEPKNSLYLTPKTIAQVFQKPRPEIIKAVEMNEFKDFEHLKEWCRENIEDYSDKDVKTLFKLNVIDHPTDIGECEEGIIKHKEQPIEVTPDIIACIPYDKQTGYIAAGDTNQ